MDVKVLQYMYYYERAKYPNIQVTSVLPAAIAVHETGNFSSNIFETKNNCFGMKAPAKRDTTALNKGLGGFAVFDSVLDSVQDFVQFLDYWNLTDDGKLDAYIKLGKYCPDKGYYDAINRTIASLQKDGSLVDYDTVKQYAFGGAATVLAAAGYAAYKLS